MIRRTALILTLLSPLSFGYVPLTTSDGTPLRRNDNAGIQFLVSDKIAPGLHSSASGSDVTVFPAGSDPVGAIGNALATWNAVSAASVNFRPLETTSAGYNPNDNQMVVVVAATANEVSAVGGALAVTETAWTVGTNIISDSDIILNPAKSFSTDGSTAVDLQAVMTHELGHSLGANHTGLLSATMFQFNTIGERVLSTDDLAFVESTYPSTTTPQPFGTLNGRITAADGSAVPFALVTIIDTSGGTTLCALAAADGSFAVKTPPGTYQLYAEPLNETVPVNVYLTQEQLAEAGNFQPTWFRGTISVLAEATATANITVTGGPSSFAVPYIGVGGAGKSGDIATLTQILGPTEIPSGQSVDLAIVGAGYDKNLTDADFRIYGQGIWVHPGSVRVDPNASVNFGSGPLPIVRITLDIAARQQNGMASIFISKAGSTLSLSGLLTLTPPAQGPVNTPPVPTTTLQGVVNAASQLGNGTVSPGEIATVYGNNLAPSGGPYFGGFENAGFDGAGVLSGSFADVTVTFDGVPAPLFFVSSGQINLQVPFEVAGKATTQMVVSYLGSSSPPIAVPVVSIEPALFTYPIPTAAYTGNQDATANTAANPAARGSYITVYGTGLGLPSYLIETGVGAAPTSLSSGGFTCTFGGIPTTVLYAGWTPTSVGLAQFNIQIPENAPTGAVPVVFTNGTAATQANLTVFVK